MTTESNGISNLFKIYDKQQLGYLSSQQIFELYQEIRIGGISLTQVLASMDTITGSTDYIIFEEFKEVLEVTVASSSKHWDCSLLCLSGLSREFDQLFKCSFSRTVEIDRRYFLVQNLQWEFALLDNLHSGLISLDKGRFLFEAVQGKLTDAWDRFVGRRFVRDAPLSFAEMEVELCNPISQAHSYMIGFDVSSKRRNDGNMQKVKSSEVEGKDRVVSNNIQSHRSEVVEKEERNNLSNKVGNGDDDKVVELNFTGRRLEVEEGEKRRERRERKKKKERGGAEEHDILREDLEHAVGEKNSDLLIPAINSYKSGIPRSEQQAELLTRAERLLEMLKCSSALQSAMTKRLLADLEAAISKAKEHSFDHSRSELADQVNAADEMLLRLKRLDKLRREVLELKQSTIAELRSYHNPMPIIHDVMKATYLLLGSPEKQTKEWENVQALLGKTGRESLKRRIGLCDITKIHLSTARRAREMMGGVDLEEIRDVSAGAATFFVWAEEVIEEVISRHSSLHVV